MQNLLEAVHVTTGLPWWATVVGVAWAFRLSMLPFVLKAAGHTSRMNNIKPLVEVLLVCLPIFRSLKKCH